MRSQSPMFQLKNYQNNTLEVLANYLEEARIVGPKEVFYKILGNDRVPYHAIPGLEDIPYVCLRLPTGGGKTFLATHTVKLAAQHYVDKDYPMVLWLTPTSAIKQQTIETLKNPTHPNREVLDAAFKGNVAIFDIDDFANLRPTDIANKTCVFVSTVQSFNVKDTDIRNIYADNESLEPHFKVIPAIYLESLEKVESGKPDAGRVKNSFANLLHMHQPIVIVDEAHKAVTELNREIMKRLNPACIVEFTATPNEKESNVLYRVSAVELKAEEMIKLPIMLTETQTWQQSLTEACLMRNKLAQDAKLEKEYIRPIVLIQAESKGQEITEDIIKQHLIDNEHISADRIAIATGEQKELDGINVLDPNCPIDFIITKQALREGWDCPFAYIFCSVAQTRSLTAVEQFLGRILRMPYAKRRSQADLNKAYAYVSSACWTNAVAKLKDSLVEMGFDEQESQEYLKPEPSKLGLTYSFTSSPVDTSTLTAEEKQDRLAKEKASLKKAIDNAKADQYVPQKAKQNITTEPVPQSENATDVQAKVTPQTQNKITVEQSATQNKTTEKASVVTEPAKQTKKAEEKLAEGTEKATKSPKTKSTTKKATLKKTATSKVSAKKTPKTAKMTAKTTKIGENYSNELLKYKTSSEKQVETEDGPTMKPIGKPDATGEPEKMEKDLDSANITFNVTAYIEEDPTK